MQDRVSWPDFIKVFVNDLEIDLESNCPLFKYGNDSNFNKLALEEVNAVNNYFIKWTSNTNCIDHKIIFQVKRIIGCLKS